MGSLILQGDNNKTVVVGGVGLWELQHHCHAYLTSTPSKSMTRHSISQKLANQALWVPTSQHHGFTWDYLLGPMVDTHDTPLYA